MLPHFQSLVRRFVLCLVVASPATGVGEEVRRIRKTFVGQLAGVASDLHEKMQVDRKLRDSRFRIGKVASRIPDSQFELEFERQLRDLFTDSLDENSGYVISGEYQFIDGNETDNRGLSVIELILKVTDRRGRILQSARREVNESDDITLISNLTLSVPDTRDIQRRNDHIEARFDEPQFAVRNTHEIAAESSSNYTASISVNRGGKSESILLNPLNRGGSAFFDLNVTDTFELVLKNYDPSCLAVADVRIDGLSVINTFNEDGSSYSGYLIDKASSVKPGMRVIQGWMRSAQENTDNVFPFVINELGKGAATAKKSRNSRGVISVRFYQAALPSESLRGRAFGEVGRGKPTSEDFTIQDVKIYDTAESIIQLRYSIPSL